MKMIELYIVPRENKIDINMKRNHMKSEALLRRGDRYRTNPEALVEIGTVPSSLNLGHALGPIACNLKEFPT